MGPCMCNAACLLDHFLSRRQTFGNNPDTSKALRFLVAENRIIRSGLGGRKDPFSYVVS